MLNKKVWIILSFVISFWYFSQATYASNHAKVYLTSDKEEINQEEEIEITVNLEESKIAACNFSIYFEEENLEFVSIINQEDNTNNVSLGKNKVNFAWFDKLGGEMAKEGKIATFKFRAKENGIVTFTVNGEFYNKNGQLIETDYEEKQVKIGKDEMNLQTQIQEEQGTNLDSSNCNLQALRVDVQGLVPNFEKEIEEYYLVVPSDIQNIDVLAISENPNATVEINGNTDLQEKSRDINIKVTSADKTQNKVYTIHVSKTDDLELANTNLEILAVENVLLNPPFDTMQTNYEVEVSNKTENLNILAIPENEQAKVEIIGKDNLKEGNNLVTVLVKAQNGFTKKSYIINVNRRNLDEEEKYQEQQEKQIKDLENAYKIKKISSDITTSQEQLEKKGDKHNQNIFGIVILVFIVFGTIWVTIILMKARKK